MSGMSKLGTRLFLRGLLASLGIGMASRVYYAFFFLPRHHGSWTESLGRVVDFEGWSAYLRSSSGLAFHIALLLALIVAGVGALVMRHGTRA